jgi:hypothetical protein
MDGAKILEMLHLWTRRRMGSGTITQSLVEQERSVSAPEELSSVGTALSVPVTAKPISVIVKWWSVERKSEEGVVAMIGVDNTTRRSEGPPAGCVTATAKIFGSRSFVCHWGRPPTRVVVGNAVGRLPGGKPDEGEPHVRFGKRE